MDSSSSPQTSHYAHHHPATGRGQGLTTAGSKGGAGVKRRTARSSKNENKNKYSPTVDWSGYIHYAATLVCTMVGSGLLLMPYCFDQAIVPLLRAGSTALSPSSTSQHLRSAAAAVDTNIVNCSCNMTFTNATSEPLLLFGSAGGAAATSASVSPSASELLAHLLANYGANAALLLACGLLQLFSIHLVVVMAVAGWRIIVANGNRGVGGGGGAPSLWRTASSFREIVVVATALSRVLGGGGSGCSGGGGEGTNANGKGSSSDGNGGEPLQLATRPMAPLTTYITDATAASAGTTATAADDEEDVTVTAIIGNECPPKSVAILSDPSHHSSIIARFLDLSVAVSAGTCLIVFLQYAVGQLSAIALLIGNADYDGVATSPSPSSSSFSFADDGDGDASSSSSSGHYVGNLSEQQLTVICLCVGSLLYCLVSIPRSYHTLRYTSWTGSLLTAYLLVYAVVLGVGSSSWLGSGLSVTEDMRDFEVNVWIPNANNRNNTESDDDDLLLAAVVIPSYVYPPSSSSSAGDSDDTSSSSAWGTTKTVFVLIGIYVSLFSCQYTIPILIREYQTQNAKRQRSGIAAAQHRKERRFLRREARLERAAAEAKEAKAQAAARRALEDFRKSYNYYKTPVDSSEDDAVVGDGYDGTAGTLSYRHRNQQHQRRRREEASADDYFVCEIAKDNDGRRRHGTTTPHNSDGGCHDDDESSSSSSSSSSDSDNDSDCSDCVDAKGWGVGKYRRRQRDGKNKNTKWNPHSPSFNDKSPPADDAYSVTTDDCSSHSSSVGYSSVTSKVTGRSGRGHQQNGNKKEGAGDGCLAFLSRCFCPPKSKKKGNNSEEKKTKKKSKRSSSSLSASSIPSSSPVVGFTVASTVAIAVAFVVYLVVGISGNVTMRVLSNRLRLETCEATCVDYASSSAFAATATMHDGAMGRSPFADSVSDDRNAVANTVFANTTQPPPAATLGTRAAMTKCRTDGDYVSCVALMVHYQLSHQQRQHDALEEQQQNDEEGLLLLLGGNEQQSSANGDADGDQKEEGGSRGDDGASARKGMQKNKKGGITNNANNMAPVVFLFILRVMLLLHFLGAYPLFAVTARKALLSGLLGRSEDDAEAMAEGTKKDNNHNTDEEKRGLLATEGGGGDPQHDDDASVPTNTASASSPSSFSHSHSLLVLRRVLITVAMTVIAAVVTFENPNKMSDVFGLNGALFANITTIALPSWLFVVGFYRIVGRGEGRSGRESSPAAAAAAAAAAPSAVVVALPTRNGDEDASSFADSSSSASSVRFCSLDRFRYVGGWAAVVIAVALTVMAVLSWVLQHV